MKIQSGRNMDQRALPKTNSESLLVWAGENQESRLETHWYESEMSPGKISADSCQDKSWNQELRTEINEMEFGCPWSQAAKHR